MIGRRTFIKRAAAATALGSGLIGAPAVLRAQSSYPNKPIKFIVPRAQ